MTAVAAPAPSRMPRWSAGLTGFGATAWPVAGIALVLVMQASMVFTRAVNWDEFWFYYHVADFARGNLAQPLQSLHVRLFAWLPALQQSSVDAIVTARAVMLGCEGVTIAAIYLSARVFAPRPVSALSALLYVSAGFVLHHGFSFRTDPMVTALLMSGIAMTLRTPLRLPYVLAIGALLAVATMISIKSVLYAPALLGIAWYRWNLAGRTSSSGLLLASIPAAAACIVALLYMLHTRDVTGAATGSAMAAGASRWMFNLGLPPYWQMGLKAIATAPLLFLLAVAAPLAIWRSDRERSEKWALAGLWLPLLLPFVYMNTAAYFYVFMLAPVCVAITAPLQHAVARYSAPMLAIAATLLATGIFLMEDRKIIERQRELTAQVESMVPADTAYFDHNGMVASLSKANWLVTPAGLAAYRQEGRPVYREAMEAQVVPIFLANDIVFEDLLEGDARHFLPADAEVLTKHYLPFWGPMRIAGFELAQDERREIEILVPGPYTVRGGPITIDGVVHGPASRVMLRRGNATLAAGEGGARLLWGDGLTPPERDWDGGPLYIGF